MREVQISDRIRILVVGQCLKELAQSCGDLEAGLPEHILEIEAFGRLKQVNSYFAEHILASKCKSRHPTARSTCCLRALVVASNKSVRLLPHAARIAPLIDVGVLA